MIHLRSLKPASSFRSFEVATLLLWASLLWLPAVLASTETGSPPGDSAVAGLPLLDEGLASFGAAVAGDSLFLYGGHVGGVHQHSVDNLSHRFLRLDLKSGAAWEDLGKVRGLQGLALVSHGDRVCRLGGLDARNAKGNDDDLFSVDQAACFDPSSGWSDLPPLPSGRSSHDAVVVGDKIFVAGGWQLRGKDEEPVWHDHMLSLDLAAAEPAWREIPQPFQRRALAVAAVENTLYVFGGLGADGTSLQVDIFDITSEQWSRGPELPIADGPMRGFGVSAFGVDGRVLLSGGDGAILSLEPGADAWDKVGQLERFRFFHRLLPHDGRLLFIAGAQRGEHYRDIEVVELSSLRLDRADRPSLENRSIQASVQTHVERRWPGFRGVGSQLLPGDLPEHWSAQEGVAWRASLPGYGQSAPVVWDDQVFVTSVEGEHKEALILSAFAIENGALRWRRRFENSTPMPNGDMVTRAAPTPVVDSDGVYSFYENGDVIAVDHLGETRWRRSLTDDYGPFLGNHGVASSPVLAGDLTILQVTHEGPSYFVALDKSTGDVRWKADRPDGVAWTTPLLVDIANKPAVVTSAAGRVEALDVATGDVLWQLDGVEKNHVPSITVAGDIFVVGSSAAGHNMALRADADEPEVLWRAEGVSSGFGSPVIHGGCALIVNKAGVVTCISMQDGTSRWSRRLSGAVWATPVVAGGHVYFFTKNGDTVVLSHDTDGSHVVSENSLPTDDTVYGVAAVPGAFLVRTGKELTRLGQPAG